MSSSLDLQQAGVTRHWEWLRTNLVAISALVLIITSAILYSCLYLRIIVNPWSTLPWLVFLFTLFIFDLGLGMLILKVLDFSSGSRPLANRTLLFLAVSTALGCVDLIILGIQGVVSASYSAAGGSIMGVVALIAAFMAIPLPPPPPVVRATYRSLLAQPPSTKSGDIQQRVDGVNTIYSLLISPDTTVLALTGISGIGKSTLAALVYHEVEIRRQAGVHDFSAASLWLTIEPSRTMADLAGTLFEAFGKKMPDLHNLTGQNIAQALFDAINMSGQHRLIVLDQFDLLVDIDTGRIRADRHGVAEWLELLTKQTYNKSGSRILLTCYSRPDGPYPFLQEYSVTGLLSNEGREGIDLLRKQGVQGSEENLKTVVEHCSGHPQTLRLLKPFLEARHWSLAKLLKEGPDWAWEANTFLDPICTSLNNLEREMLSAFAIYREAIPVEAAVVLLDVGSSLSHVEKWRTIDGLARWNLLFIDNNTQRDSTVYQLHLIVRQYMLGRYRSMDKQKAHKRAAQYYLTLPGYHPQRKHEQMSDVNYLIESFWHYCQAGQLKEAYDLIEQEGLREDLLRWGRKSVLLELYQSLLSLEDWKPDGKVAVDIYRQMASIYSTLGYKEQILKYYQEALNVSKSGDADNLEMQGDLLNDLSHTWSELEKGSEAQKCADEALKIGNALDNSRLEGNALNNLGRASRVLRNRDATLDYFEQALALYEKDNNKIGKARTLNNIGIVYFEMCRQYEDAQYNFEDALKISREKVDDEIEARTLNEIEAIALNNLGNCYNISPEDEGYLGDIFRSWNEAKQYYEDALVIRRKREDIWEQVPVLNNLSQVCQRLNELEDAQQYGQQALEISQEVGNLSGQVSAILNLGDLCQMEKKPQSIQHAFNYYQQAWEASRKVDYLEGKSRSAVRLGDLCLEQSHHKEALACFLCARLMSDSLARVVQRKIDVLRKSVNEQAFKELQADIEPVTCQMTEHIFMKGLQNLEVM